MSYELEIKSNRSRLNQIAAILGFETCQNLWCSLGMNWAQNFSPVLGPKFKTSIELQPALRLQHQHDVAHDLQRREQEQGRPEGEVHGGKHRVRPPRPPRLGHGGHVVLLQTDKDIEENDVKLSQVSPFSFSLKSTIKYHKHRALDESRPAYPQTVLLL